MVIAAFLMTDKPNKVKFYEETFVIANVGLKVVFGILFLTLSNIHIDFLDWKL